MKVNSFDILIAGTRQRTFLKKVEMFLCSWNFHPLDEVERKLREFRFYKMDSSTNYFFYKCSLSLFTKMVNN